MKTTPVIAALLRDNPIAVTGQGCFSAAGNSVEALWQAAVTGRSFAAWRDFEHESAPSRFAVCGAPELDAADSALHPVRKQDRSVQIAWLAASQAWTQAQIMASAYAPERIGILAGSSRGPLGKQPDSLGQGKNRRPLPSQAAASTFASLSGALAQAFELKGPGATISATCASAAFAIGLAAEQLLLGKADAMLVGGSEAPLQAGLLAQFHASKVLGFHSEVAQTCRPFDTTRNGLVLGEGSAFLILEPARAAVARGAKIHALLAGWAMSLDNSGRTGVSEDGTALRQVMEQALALAGLAPEQIDYINAHGTGTQLNDLAEAQAVRTLFGQRAENVPCSSTKPVTGHCLGATPALEAVLSVEALRHQIVPPTANCSSQDPLCAINVQPLCAQPRKISAVMSNSLGFWGYHASLILTQP